MDKPKRTEPHNTNSGLVRDIIIGMSDGLTVPFALTAGLKGPGRKECDDDRAVLPGRWIYPLVPLYPA